MAVDIDLAGGPLTILIAVPTLDAGAADDGAVELVRILTRAGHRAIVVSRGGRRQQEVTAAGGCFIATDVASKNPFVMLCNCLTLARIIRSHRCDIVHAHGRAPAWSAYVAARINGVPFLTTWYKGFREQNFAKRLYNSVMARGDRVTVVSKQLAQLVRDRYRVPDARLVMIPRIVDLDGFDPGAVSPARMAAMRQAWGASPETRVILVVGRMLRRKGHHIVVQALQHLQQRGVKGILCVFIGEDPGHSRYLGELWDLVLATGTGEILRLAGPAADLPAAYAAATVVVSAAVQPEGVQRAILEAQAMAQPVITSDQGGEPDPAPASERASGLRVPAGDPVELADAIGHILALPEASRRVMGACGRELVLTRFGTDASAVPLLKIYREVASARDRSRLSRR